MLDMDGFEVICWICVGDVGEWYVDIFIIVLMVNVMKGDREVCEEVGMNDYFSKFFDVKDFFDKV